MSFIINPHRFESAAPADSFPNYIAKAADAYGYSASHAVAMPAGITAGNRIVVFWAGYVGGSGTLNPTPVEAGWTRHYIVEGFAYATCAMFSKVATGSDTLTLSLDKSAAGGSAAFLLDKGVFAGHNAAGSGGTTTIDPPSLTRGTSRKYMWFACGFGRLLSYAPASGPSGYSQYIAAANNCGAAVALKQKEGTTEDPGAMTAGGSVNVVAYTVAFSSD